MSWFINKVHEIAAIDPNLLSEAINENPPNQKVILYQLFPRLFGNKQTSNIFNGSLPENGCGKFNDITSTALKALKSFGITHIWYTGIIEHATMQDYRDYGIALDHPEVVKGRAGSPYAIKDYFDVDPDLAENIPQRMEEFENLVERSHENDIKVVIDFVPNHVARNYTSDAKPAEIEDLGSHDDPSLRFHPRNNFYYIPDFPFQVPTSPGKNVPHTDPGEGDNGYYEFPAKATGNNVFKASPGYDDWFETVKLNYGINYEEGATKHFTPIPDTWKKMLDILLYWAGKGVDGFRCDMAEMVPVEFWDWVIPNVKAHFPEMIFIAEIYQPEQYRNFIFHGQFDYLYDKVQLYDGLRNIIEQKLKADILPDIWHQLKGINHHMLRFLENHDEQRIASQYFTGDPFRALPAMTVAATWFTGPVMFYNGQEVGEASEEANGFSGADGRTTIFDYRSMPEHQKWMNEGKFDGKKLSAKQQELRKFYAQLILRCQEPAIHEGFMYDLHPHNRAHGSGYTVNTYSFLRFTAEQQLLIIVNFDHNHPVNCNLKIPRTAIEAMGLEETRKYRVKDIFLSDQESTFYGGHVVTNEIEEGLLLGLEPLGCYIFQLFKE